MYSDGKNFDCCTDNHKIKSWFVIDISKIESQNVSSPAFKSYS